MIKAIETVYNGYRFRSRLEARWAVFFDTLGIRYEYEKEGFELPSGRYLPDFWLLEQGIWFEVKGKEPTKREGRLITELCAATSKEVILYHGPVELPQKWEIKSIRAEYKGICTYFAYSLNKLPNGTQILKEILIQGVRHFQVHGPYVACTTNFLWGQCPICGKLDLVKEGRGCCIPCIDRGVDSLNAICREDSPMLLSAYCAARQARFEYGENGR